MLSVYGQEKALSLSLQGSNTLESKIINRLSYAKNFTDLNTLKQETQNVTNQLIDKGYIDAHLRSLKKTDSSLSYTGTIDIKSLYKLTYISVPSNPLLIDYIKQAGLEIKEDTIKIETAFAKALLEQLTEIASNNGNPFASFQLNKITKTKNNSLAANLDFITQKKRTIDNIVIKGYEKFPKIFLKRYAKIKTKKSFNQEELLNQNRDLNALSFVKSIKEPEVLFKKDSTTIYFYLKQVSSNRLDGILGFATDENTNNLQLDGYVDLQLTNNFNYGETFLLNYKSDGGDQSQLNISATLPYLFKSPLGIEAKLALFRKDSTFSVTSQEVKAFYTATPTIKTSIGYQSTQSEDLQDNQIINDNAADYTSTKLLVSGQYHQTQNNYFFPTKTLFSISSSLGDRITDQPERQINLEIDANKVINLDQKNSFYIRSKTQVIWSNNLIINELYRFGGVTSIRGFEENSLFANLQSTLNTEYRYIFNQSLYIHSVIDLAYFENSVENQTTSLVSFGAGAGVRTKAGILKIIIANGKSTNNTININNTKLHFQLAIRF